MPKGVYIRSEEHKRQSALSLRESYKKYYANHPGPMTGKKHSVDAKKKIGLASSSRTVTEETRIKIGNIHRGKKHSEETKLKISQKHKLSGKRPPSRKGIPLSDETKKKMSITRTGMVLSAEHRRKIGAAQSGAKSRFWKGGITNKNKKIRNSLEYRLWREAVVGRDKYTCVLCGAVSGTWIKEQKRKIAIHADHIKPFSLYPELRLDVNNGRTLCVDCHLQTETFGKFNHAI